MAFKLENNSGSIKLESSGYIINEQLFIVRRMFIKVLIDGKYVKHKLLVSPFN
jgi:hypothetical protein